MFVANTNLDIFYDPDEHGYYLFNQESRLTTKDAVNGPLAAVTTLPTMINEMNNISNLMISGPMIFTVLEAIRKK